MNYYAIYYRLMDRAKNRILSAEYLETHHIIPRCLGGTDAHENLIQLTPEEHYIAHQLLTRIYPNNKKIIFAAHMMTVGLRTHRKNKAYGWLRKKMSETSSGAGNHMFGKKHSPDRKKKSGRYGEQNAFFGKKHSVESRKKMSDSKRGRPGLRAEKNGMYGKKHSQETKDKISRNNPYTGTARTGLHPNTGRPCPEELKEHCKKLFTGKKIKEEVRLRLMKPKGPQKIVVCPHCGKQGGISNLTRYHFNNCKHKVT